MSKRKRFITKGVPEVMCLVVCAPGRSKMQRKEVTEVLRDEYEMDFNHTISANEHVCVIMADMCCLFMREMKKEKRSSNVRNKKGWLFMAMPEEEKMKGGLCCLRQRELWG